MTCLGQCKTDETQIPDPFYLFQRKVLQTANSALCIINYAFIFCLPTKQYFFRIIFSFVLSALLPSSDGWQLNIYKLFMIFHPVSGSASGSIYLDSALTTLMSVSIEFTEIRPWPFICSSLLRNVLNWLTKGSTQFQSNSEIIKDKIKLTLQEW